MFLEKKNVSLYYEVCGQGIPLVLIHGVMVDADFYRRAAHILAKKYMVVTFDRRGNSRSKCREEAPFSIGSQAEDIKDLLDELKIGSAYVVGVSAGAAIGLKFLEKYPERVMHMILYEPAVLGMVKKEPEIQKWMEKMRFLIADGKYNTALLEFFMHLGSFDDRAPQKDAETSVKEMGNVEYALKKELPGLSEYMPDLESLKRNERKVTFAVGEKSGDTVYVRIGHKLSEKVGKRALFYPGFHNLAYDLPEEFAVCVHGTLQLL